MSFTPQHIVNDVRLLVQDTKSPYRYADSDILAMVNQAINRLAILRPDLVADIGTMNCVQGAVQRAPADSIRLMEVLQVVGGGNMNEINREAVDLMFPTWQTMTPTTPSNWIRHPRNPNMFMVYPPATAGVQLSVEYAQSPPVYALSDTVQLVPDAYKACITDATVWLIESFDNEHIGTGRAKQFQETFMQALGVDSQNRQMLDTEEAGEPPDKVY